VNNTSGDEALAPHPKEGTSTYMTPEEYSLGIELNVKELCSPGVLDALSRRGGRK